MPLVGVSETALMTLYNRGSEAARPDALIRDPLAAELLARLDYPFAEHFGKPDLSHVLRALQYDGAVLDFLGNSPHGTVVALGEGLETEFWRVDNGTLRWWTVDLPAVVDLRRELLPAAERATPFAGDAFDLDWADAVIDPGPDVLILAQGLFMYFPEDRVRALVSALVERFPRGRLVFDTIPAWATTDRGHRQSRAYRMPPQPWGIGRGALPRIRDWHPGIAGLRVLDMPRGRGFGWGVVYPGLAALPVLRGLTPMTIELRFG